MILRTKVILIGLLVVLLVGVPPGLGQQPPVDSQGNLYSIWLKLSLMGHNQSEIEAILNGVTPEQLNRIKNQLRRDVLNTLRRLNLHNEISMSTTEQELFTIREKNPHRNPVRGDGKRFPPAQDDPAPVRDCPAKHLNPAPPTIMDGYSHNPPPSGGGWGFTIHPG